MAYVYTNTPSSVVSRVINTIVSIVILALGLRLILQLFGANPSAGFVSWVYAITQPLVNPFENMFPALSLGQFAIDTSTIIAMIAYAILGWLVMYLFSFLLASVTPYEYEPRARDVV